MEAFAQTTGIHCPQKWQRAALLMVGLQFRSNSQAKTV